MQACTWWGSQALSESVRAWKKTTHKIRENKKIPGSAISSSNFIWRRDSKYLHTNNTHKKLTCRGLAPFMRMSMCECDVAEEAETPVSTTAARVVARQQKRAARWRRPLILVYRPCPTLPYKAFYFFSWNCRIKQTWTDKKIKYNQ